MSRCYEQNFFLLVWAKNSTLINTNMYLKCIHEFSKHTSMYLDQLEHQRKTTGKIAEREKGNIRISGR